MDPATDTQDQVQHKYGTRKRQNSIMRPSLRLREGATAPLPTSHPRRIRPLGTVTHNALSNDITMHTKPSTPSGIVFPPPSAVLHPEDASNKTFLAMGRAFLSQGNRAMTVKDIAELCLNHGLVCQSVSAAAQAVTSFIRNHLHRCDLEGDYPLILRYHLTGTSRDDQLVPALYSRSGGNVGKEKTTTKDKAGTNTRKDENGFTESGAHRLTCFRRGTVVWYLSKAAGVPCPFAKCGIAVEDSVDLFMDDGKTRRTDADSLRSGLKRKRDGLRVRRHCVSRTGLYQDHEEDENDDLLQGRKPLKVKLTLRLAPPAVLERNDDSSASDSSSDDGETDETMTVDDSSSQSSPFSPYVPKPLPSEKEWTLPPYPIQRRISIPPYTPSEAGFPSYSNFGSGSSHWDYFPSYKRPSVDSLDLLPSPPPESDDEEEDEDLCVSPSSGLAGHQPLPYSWDNGTHDGYLERPERDVLSDDFPAPDVKVEDNSSESFLVGRSWAFTQASTFDLRDVTVKSEAVDELNMMDSIADIVRNVSHMDLETRDIKLEEFEVDLLSFDVPSPTPDWQLGTAGPWVPYPGDHAPLAEHVGGSEESSTTLEGTVSDSNLAWKNVELLGPDSVLPQEFEDDEWDHSSSNDLDASDPIEPRLLANQTCLSQLSSTSPQAFRNCTSPSALTCTASCHNFEAPTHSLSPAKILRKLARPPLTVVNEGIPNDEVSTPWERGMFTHWDDEEAPLPTQSFPSQVATDSPAEEEQPLSLQEEEMFQALCRHADWEQDGQTPQEPAVLDPRSSDVVDEEGDQQPSMPETPEPPPADPPLRRSKRVSNAVRPTSNPRVTRSRTKKRTAANSSFSAL